jgi:hypothetical protein
MDQNERDKAQPLVTEEARKHDTYVGLDNGARQNITASPLTRWRTNKSLSPSQLAAIYHYLRLVDLVGIEPARTTGSYCEPIRGTHIGSHEPESLQLAIRDAKDDMKRLEGYFAGLETYWSIFVNCIRFDEPAGVAGSKLGHGTRTAKARAHQVVCFVADIIATKERLSH